MKKLIYIFIGIIALIGISSCKCQSEKQAEPTFEQSELIVENVVSADKEKMFLDYGSDYRWFETCIVLNDYLDEADSCSINGISNIFQVVTEMESGTDVNVVMFTHVGDTTNVQVVHTFWIEDSPMNNDSLAVTFTDAYEKVMEVNLPKPHSKHVVLRKEVGPLEANPQYIFGNQESQIYVDATTGEVRNYNPVFPKDGQLNYAFTW